MALPQPSQMISKAGLNIGFESLSSLVKTVIPVGVSRTILSRGVQVIKLTFFYFSMDFILCPSSAGFFNTHLRYLKVVRLHINVQHEASPIPCPNEISWGQKWLKH